MDVTDQVLQSHILYGGSDNTNARNTSASFSINYAHGTSIHKPIEASFTSIPYTMKFQEALGLPGVDNCFYKVNLDVESVSGCLEDDGYECVKVNWVDEADPGWEGAEYDFYKDLTISGFYEPAEFSQKLPIVRDPRVSVELINKGTGNKYNDVWLDVCLYDANRRAIPEDSAWIGAHGYFYIGFHARNTKRLPYDVECVIGRSYVGAADVKEIDKRAIAGCLC